MDANRFDRLSRTFARRMNRRQAVQALGATGLTTAAIAALRHDAPQVAAQTDGAACLLDLTASVRIGPSTTGDLGSSTPGELRGQLRFNPESLSDATFVLENGMEFAASGQATGPAITLRVAIPLGGTLILVGAGERSIRACEGPVDGLLTGPAPGDLGDWHGTLSGNEASEPSSEPTSVFGGTSGGSGGDSSTNPSPTPESQDPTPTPTESSSLECVPTGGTCQPGDCCGSDTPCTSGVCQCKGNGTSCRPESGVFCCDGLECRALGCCGPEGIPCATSSDCCNFCTNGFCSLTPPEPPPPACINTGESCAEVACCAGNYCDQDAICRCDGSGQICTTGDYCCSFVCQNGFCL